MSKSKFRLAVRPNPVIPHSESNILTMHFTLNVKILNTFEKSILSTSTRIFRKK